MPEYHGLFEYLAMLDRQEDYQTETGLHLIAFWIKRYLVENSDLFSRTHPYFTLHDYRHSDAVATHLFNILQTAQMLDLSISNALSRYETFYLLAGAYLHDVGMFISRLEDEQRSRKANRPIGDVIRADHHIRSAEFVYKERERFFLTEQDADIIGALCKGHRLSVSLTDKDFEIKFDDRARPIRVGLLAGLLRIADELDISHSRAPEQLLEHLEKFKQFNKLARMHWMKHHYTQAVWFSPGLTPDRATKVVHIHIDLRVPDEIHKRRFEMEIGDRIQEHLAGLDLIMSRYGFIIDFGGFRSSVKGDLVGLVGFVLRRRDVRILYADDEELYRQRVEHALQDRRFVHIDLATNAQEASLKLVEVGGQPDRQYHLIILDLHMPNLHGQYSENAGKELIEPARYLCPHAQIIVFTGSAPDASSIIDEILDMGVEVISKNQGFDALAEEVEESLRLNYIVIDDEE